MGESIKISVVLSSILQLDIKFEKTLARSYKSLVGNPSVKEVNGKLLHEVYALERVIPLFSTGMLPTTNFYQKTTISSKIVSNFTFPFFFFQLFLKSFIRKTISFE